MGAQRGGFGTYLILVGRVPLLQPSIRATAISGVALFFLGKFWMVIGPLDWQVFVEINRHM